MINAKYTKPDIAGMKPKQQLEALNVETHNLVKRQYQVFEKLVKGMNEQGLVLLQRHEELTAKQAEYVDQYFMDNV